VYIIEHIGKCCDEELRSWRERTNSSNAEEWDKSEKDDFMHIIYIGDEENFKETYE
jgi:hypothetical protein